MHLDAALPWSLVSVLCFACAYALWSRERVASELRAVRAELRELGRRAARARAPARTQILPALSVMDPEEFRRTSVRLARYSAE